MLVFMNDDLIDMKDNHLMLSRMDNEETLENCKEDSVDKIIVDNEHEPPCVLVFLQDDV